MTEYADGIKGFEKDVLGFFDVVICALTKIAAIGNEQKPIAEWINLLDGEYQPLRKIGTFGRACQELKFILESYV